MDGIEAGTSRPQLEKLMSKYGKVRVTKIALDCTLQLECFGAKTFLALLQVEKVHDFMFCCMSHIVYDI